MLMAMEGSCKSEIFQSTVKGGAEARTTNPPLGLTSLLEAHATPLNRNQNTHTGALNVRLGRAMPIKGRLQVQNSSKYRRGWCRGLFLYPALGPTSLLEAHPTPLNCNQNTCTGAQNVRLGRTMLMEGRLQVRNSSKYRQGWRRGLFLYPALGLTSLLEAHPTPLNCN